MNYLRFLLNSLCGCLVAAALQPSWGMDLNPDEIRGSNVINPVVVLQNRYFTKIMRPEIGFSAGKFLNEAYTDTATVGVRGALFFNEWAGIEFQYSQTNVSDSQDRLALNKLQYRELASDQVVSHDVETNPVSNAMDVN